MTPVPNPSTPPQHCPTPRELDDLELLVTGALHPTVAFNEPDSPITLSLPPEIEEPAREAGAVELVDPEGLPLARVAVPGGTVTPLSHAEFGPFRRLYLSPAAAQQRYAGRTLVPVTGPLTDVQIESLRQLGPSVLVSLVGAGTPDLSSTALVRATLSAAEALPDAEVIAVPLAAHGGPVADAELRERVVNNYAAGNPVFVLPQGGTLPDAIAAIVDADQPSSDRRGLVLFFTGLSGSGKSTLARALMDRLLEQGTRSVTTLDGDVVRRHLSAGLTFSREDRETNIRRIGWVAAEISRHGGVAVCSPIAPFAETRDQVREMVEDAGGVFFLIHVATPLEECERRDRKGLYAKARRGEIPEFTGISSPYEEPTDADVRVDTTGRTIDAALDDVLHALRSAGYLDLTVPPVVEEGALAPVSKPPSPVVEERAQPPVVEERAPASVSKPPSPVVEEGALANPVVEEGALAPVSKPPSPTPETPLNILFVCTANICRSPFMELLARQIAGPGAPIGFTSAGTHGFQGAPMDGVMAKTLGPRGVSSAEGFSSRPLTEAILDEADLVLTAETAHRTFILDDHPAMFRKVFTLGQFAESVRTSGSTLRGRELIQDVAHHRGTASGELDVHDPYRQGSEAAEKAASGIESLLRRIIPTLLPSRRTTP